MKFLIGLTVLNLAVSSTTLAIVIVGGRRVKAEVEVVKTKTNDKFKKLVKVLTEVGD